MKKLNWWELYKDEVLSDAIAGVLAGCVLTLVIMAWVLL